MLNWLDNADHGETTVNNTIIKAVYLFSNVRFCASIMENIQLIS